MWPHWTRLVRLAVAKGAGWHDAEDLASEAITRAVQSRTLDDAQTTWPYLARILINLAIDQRRRRTLELASLRRVAEIPSPRRPDDEAVDIATATRELRRLYAMESLETVRLVIDYAECDVTWGELGMRHGLSAAAARRRVSRALRRLRDRAQAELSGRKNLGHPYGSRTYYR